MELYYQEPYAQIIYGDCREVLANLPAESVQCVVTSPPYWGKRKYAGEQDLVWGGSEGCEHKWDIPTMATTGTNILIRGKDEVFTPLSIPSKDGKYKDDRQKTEQVGAFCSLCGAWKGGYGVEPTPEMYVNHTIEILRLIRRVLRKDGIIFWNIGDSYFGSTGGEHDYREDKHLQQDIYDFKKPQSIGKHPVLKSKDLCLIPFRVAIAAQEDGWWVRRDIIWSKTNPKPESVTDRPTASHDYILMLTKSDDYYWDREAVREPLQYDEPRTERIIYRGKSGRNIRSVWTFPTQSFSGAHFAIFPDELPETCIKAATPEVGCCARCGAPWERMINPTDEYAKALAEAKGDDWFPRSTHDGYGKSRHATGGSAQYETLGWQPTCNCNADKVPSLVLDPFSGTGTTGKVAKALGRKSILIDTSETYCKMARNRIEKVALPMIFPVEKEIYPEAPEWF